jgi:hypothetical protein
MNHAPSTTPAKSSIWTVHHDLRRVFERFERNPRFEVAYIKVVFDDRHSAFQMSHLWSQAAYHSMLANIPGTACYHFAIQFSSTSQDQAGRGDIAASNCADNSLLRDTSWYVTIRG